MDRRVIFEPPVEIIRAEYRQLEATTDRITVGFQKVANVRDRVRQGVLARKRGFDVRGSQRRVPDGLWREAPLPGWSRGDLGMLNRMVTEVNTGRLRVCPR